MITASVTTAHSPDTWNNKWKTLQKLQQIKQNCCNSISDNCALTRSMRFFSSPISSGSDTSLLLLTDSTSRQPRKHTAVERTDNWLRLYTKKKNECINNTPSSSSCCNSFAECYCYYVTLKRLLVSCQLPTSYNFMLIFVLVDSYLFFQVLPGSMYSITVLAKAVSRLML